MLMLSEAEQQALQIVVLRTSVEAEKHGAAHQLNWKKIGLSRAYFRQAHLTESRMPTHRAVAAFRFLQEHNEYYKAFLRQHNTLLDTGGILTISSYDLFAVTEGTECAMYPHLYPTTRFTDTGIRSHMRAEMEDNNTRVVSIARSWTRKALSSVRVYVEHRD